MEKLKNILKKEGKRYKMTKENAVHILHVFAWTIASAAVAGAITFVGDLEVAPQYLFMVAIVNTLLVTGKEFINSKR